jgi:hypothetical protein
MLVMQDELVNTAKEYSEIQDRLGGVKAEIEELREETFGDDSEDTEKKARTLFDEVGQASGEKSKTEQLDTLREEKEQLQDKKAETEEDLLELLVDVRFPLDETIKGEEPPVEFPFSESIDSTVLDAISEALAEDMGEGKVEIRTDAIVVDTASIDEAIEAVEHKITQIRERADANLDVPAQVKKIKDRDWKVAAMLYVLKQNGNEPMSKAEIEDEMSVERGDLRGQLYYVLNNDPYLKKQENGITLTANGTKVIERFVQQHGEPKVTVSNQQEKSNDGETKEDDTSDTDDAEEVTAHE